MALRWDYSPRLKAWHQDAMLAAEIRPGVRPFVLNGAGELSMRFDRIVIGVNQAEFFYKGILLYTIHTPIEANIEGTIPMEFKDT